MDLLRHFHHNLIIIFLNIIEKVSDKSIFRWIFQNETLRWKKLE